MANDKGLWPYGVNFHPLVYLFVVFPAAFYGYTLAPTIGFGDTAILVDAIQQQHLSAHVNNHPLTVLMGMIFNALVPSENLALRANLVSFFFGSLTVTVFFVAMYRETASLLTSVVAALLLMVSHSLWWHSTQVENYAVSAFLTVICILLWCEFRRSQKEALLYGLCVVGGFSLFNHVQMAFVCVGIATTGVVYAFGLPDRKLRVVLNCSLAALVGLAPWLIFVVVDAARAGSLALALKGALIGEFGSTFFSGSLAASLLDTLYLFWFQSPAGLALVLGIIGLWRTVARGRKDSRKDPIAIGMVVAFLLNTLNFAFYATWDKFAFLLVSFIFFYFFAGLGLAWFRTVLVDRPAVSGLILGWLALSLVVGPYFYRYLAYWAQDPQSFWYQRYNNNYSANLYFQSGYITNPDKRGNYEVEAFANQLFKKLPPDAIFLDDDSRTYYPLAEYFQRYYHVRPDINVVMVNSWGISNWGLGADTLSDLMVRAYQQNKPFFAATLQFPIGQFIAQAQQKVPLDFTPFELGEGRWVYRLVTADEKYPGKVDYDSILQETDFAPVNIAAPAGEIDVSLDNLLFYTGGEPVLQDMTDFSGHWRESDHVLYLNTKAGSYIQFGLVTPTEEKVRLWLDVTTAPDFGKVKVTVSDLRKVVDLYSPGVWRKSVPLGDVILAPGLNQLTLHIDNKHPDSTGYNMAVDVIRYQRIRQ